MNYAHKWLKVETWAKPITVKTLGISDISWLLPSEDFPEEFLVSSNFLNVPTKVDNSLKMLEVDSLCNWKVTEDTPLGAIKKWFLLNFHSVNPENPAFEWPVQQWVKSWVWKEKYWAFWNIITDYSDEVCPRWWISNTTIKLSLSDSDKLFIWNNNIDLSYISERAIIKAEVFMWEVLLTTVEILENSQQWITLAVPIPAHFSNSKITLNFKLTDSEYYSYDKEVNIEVLATDNVKPTIDLDNSNLINLKSWEKINITWSIKDQSPIQSIKYILNWILINEDNNINKINYLLDSNALNVWDNILEIEVSDSNANLTKNNINIILGE